MRNLKKFLALVLAMVMAFSLMLTANAAVKYDDYQDKDQITEEFKEAVQVLTGLEVFQGDENGFRPGDTITRAEAAAIIYRIATQDVAGTQERLYSDYGTFKDVNKDDWFAGYVGYCQNAGYIKGTTPTTFNPYLKVTGYEMLAMILRVVGYGKNNEFTGSQWQVNVASLSKELGVINKVKSANFEHTLTMAARRDVVASLMFETMVKVPTVTYTPALSYSDKVSVLSAFKNPTLGQKNFGLYCEGVWKAVDKWGRPGYNWYKDGAQWRNNDGELMYDSQTKLPIYTKKTSGTPASSVIATIMPKATKTYNTADIRECDVAHDLDFDDEEFFNLFVNSGTVTTDKYRIESTDTVTRVGGQGRETNFWYDVTSEYAGDMDPWCTMVDTFLAQVTKVNEVVVDHNNHIIKQAELHLDVWDLGNSGAVDHSNDTTFTNTKVNTIYNHNDTLNDSTSGTETDDVSKHVAKKNNNWEFSVGDYVLVKGYTDKTQGENNATNNTKLNHVLAANPQEAIEKTAFETNRLDPDDTANNLTVGKKVTPVLAKQTTTYWNTGKHQVEGEDKPDALTLYMNYAGTTTNTTYAWYYDEAGNIIGIGPVPGNVNYGVITSIYSALKQGEANTTGEAVAMAHVKYADGTEADIVIDRFLSSSSTPTTPTGHTAPAAGAFGTTMQKGATTVELIPVYDYNTGAGTNLTMQATDTGSTSSLAADQAYLHIAPVASVNKTVDRNDGNYFGIILGNMYRFEASADGKVTAIEVAGDNTNDGRYDDHYNIGVDTTAVGTTGYTESRLVKNLGYITTNNSGSQIGANTIWVDDGTKFIVRLWSVASGKPTNNVVCYDGLSAVPGNVAIYGDEIDYADTDRDGRAEYVYFNGEITGSITYGLFYYNGGAAQWNGTTGTIYGWLNGEQTTVTFNNENDFKAVRDSQSYAAHIFALQLTNGMVSDVMQGKNTENSGFAKQLLIDDATPWNTTGTKLGANLGDAANLKTTGGTVFGLGSVNSAYNNPYTATTEIVYYNDGNGTDPNTTDVDYEKTNSVYGTVNAGGTLYYVTPNTKIFGIGMGVTHGEAVLEYLDASPKNDVTIIYENGNMKSIVEIYVATDPNVTPSNPNTGVTAAFTNRQVHYKTTDINGTESSDHILLAGINTYASADLNKGTVVDVVIPFIGNTVSVDVSVTQNDGSTNLGYYSAAYTTLAAAQSAEVASGTKVTLNAGDNVYIKVGNNTVAGGSATEFVILHVIVSSN